MKGNCCFSTRVGKRQFFKLLQKFNRDIMCVATSRRAQRSSGKHRKATARQRKKRSFLRWGTADERPIRQLQERNDECENN